MKKKTTKIIAFSGILVVLIGFIIFFSVNNESKTNNVAASENKTSETSEKESASEEESLVYLGKSQAENEIILLFDYSCPYCHKWISEVFPKVESELIQSGKAKFRTQSMVYLNELSLKFAKMDQNIKVYQPDKYYSFFFDVMSNETYFNLTGDTVNDYVSDLQTKYNLQDNVINEAPKLDVINLTRKYTKKYNVESVPTVIVNGKVVEDPFNYSEIRSDLK